MPKSEGSVIINIPIEKVFNAVADPEEMNQKNLEKTLQALKVYCEK
jgi:hypothetical protein